MPLQTKLQKIGNTRYITDNFGDSMELTSTNAYLNSGVGNDVLNPVGF